MLDQVKEAIISLKPDTFPEHFIQHVMNVQDISIDQELKFLRNRNTSLSANSMIHIMNNLCERMLTE